MSQLPSPPNQDPDFSLREQPYANAGDGSEPGEAQIFLENQALKHQVVAQTQLMQLLTHQLATPLTALRGSVHLLEDPALGLEQRREFLTVVEQQVKRLIDLLQDLTALRDLETGALDSLPVYFSVPTLVEEVMAGFHPHPVSYCFSPQLPQVWADRWQVSQVLINLVSNAIKYTPTGSAIEIGAKLFPTGWLEVWVQDRGLGIPDADKPHVFERFYRVKHRDRSHITGTGLGLSLCKLLVENQGGQMGFESEHGKGSRFYFTLPTTPLLRR